MTPPPSGLADAAGSLRQDMTAASSICQISPTRCQARTTQGLAVRPKILREAGRQIWWRTGTPCTTRR
jgi:hypothetical protein